MTKTAFQRQKKYQVIRHWDQPRQLAGRKLLQLVVMQTTQGKRNKRRQVQAGQVRDRDRARQLVVCLIFKIKQCSGEPGKPQPARDLAFSITVFSGGLDVALTATFSHSSRRNSRDLCWLEATIIRPQRKQSACGADERQHHLPDDLGTDELQIKRARANPQWWSTRLRSVPSVWGFLWGQLPR